MKTIKIISILFSSFILSFLFFFVINFENPSEISEKKGTVETVNPKLFFETNKGQVDDKVKFISNGLGYSLFLMENGAELAFKTSDESKDDEWSYIQMRLEGAQKPKQINGRNKLNGKTNYLIGKNKDKWLTNIPNYSEVFCEDVYPGIDLVYYGGDGLLEYDFVVSPTAILNDIILKFVSDKNAKIDKHGNLVFKNKDAEIIIKAPVAYQVIDDKQIAVDARFSKIDKNRIGFEVGDYNKDLTLIIDPKVIFSTYFGNSSNSIIYDIALDDDENIYIAGTKANDYAFPKTHMDLPHYGTDIFITKMTPDGTELIYSTIFGGDGSDKIESITVDHDGNLLVAGRTTSEQFPLVKPIQSIFRGDEDVYEGDGFVTKINPEGDDFVYSTYLGGNTDDCIYDIAVDETGNAFITGEHSTEYFPYKNQLGVFDCGDSYRGAFVAKINPTGGLEFASCLGASSKGGYGIATDINNDVYITGRAYNSDFYTSSGAFNTTGTDAFVIKLNNSGSSVLYSTFLYRTAGWDESCMAGKGNAITVDTLGNAYITGIVGCNRLSLESEFQSSGKAFVSKLSDDGSSLLFSSYIGGVDSNDEPNAIGIDKTGNIYVTGRTGSSNLLIVDGFQTSLNGTYDAFFAAIDGQTYELIYSSYLGGEGNYDNGYGIAVTPNGYVYLAGEATNGFPTENASQETITSTYDSYIVKLIVKEEGKLEVEPTQLIFPYIEPGQTAEESVELSNSGLGLLEITKITVEPTTIYSLEDVPTLPYKLEPEQDVDFKVVYSPVALKSLKNTSDEDLTLTITSKTNGVEEDTEITGGQKIIINDTSDVSDNPGDNICDINLSEDGYQVTLRAAIEFVNSRNIEEAIKVTFEIPMESTPVFHPQRPFDPIEHPISLDASTQENGYVILDGSQAAGEVNGLIINSGESMLKCLYIKNFGANGILLSEKGSNIIDECEITGNGTTATDDNKISGMFIYNSSDNEIKGCRISQNKGYGIVLDGTKFIENNIIKDNRIGTDVLGITSDPNEKNGVEIKKSITKTTIIDNIISGNKGYGIALENESYNDESKTQENLIQDNIIGLNIFLDTLPNMGGIYLYGPGVTYNSIAYNIIAGNNGDGIRIINNSADNYMLGNVIGITRNTRIGNVGHGISLERVQDNAIDTNIIVNNYGCGIYIYNEEPRVNTINHNYIGRVSYNYHHDSIHHNNSMGGIYVENGAPTITHNYIYDHDTSGIQIVNGIPMLNFNDIAHNKTGIDLLGDDIVGESDDIHKIIVVNKNDIWSNGTGLRIKGVEYANKKSKYLKSGTGLKILSNKNSNDYGGYQVIVSGNFLYGNDENSGILIDNSSVLIRGNWIGYSYGNGISVKGEEKVTATLNNIYYNLGYGLENFTPGTIINATNNFWGDSTGPSGLGQGLGDKVSEGVNYTDWRTEKISVYASAERDTFPAVIGQYDSLMLVFENLDWWWDTLNVTISDKLGWVQANNPRQVRTPYYSDDVATLFFTIPEETKNNTFNEVTLKAVSQVLPSDSMVSVFYIHAQKPVLQYMLLFPNTLNIEANSTMQFSIYGYDQTNHLMDFTKNWSCTGGTIDDNGLFTAGNVEGTFYVIAEDLSSGLRDTAIVSVTNAVQVDVEISKAVKKQLLHCYPNPFNSSAIVKYELENPGYVTLSVYNSIGQEVDKLVDGFLPSGTYEINWQPKGLKNGTYFSKIEISSTKNKIPVYTEVQKMVYVKLE